LGDTAGDEDETPFAEMLARTVRRGGLEGVRLDEGLVEVLDVGSARRWVARHVDLRVSARDERLVGEASLVADLEGHETTLTVTASDHADATVTVHVTIADLAPSTLNGRPGPQLPGLLDGIGLTLAGTADLSLDAQLRLQRLTATFSSGAGTVTLPDEALDLAVLRAGLGVTYEAAEDATTLVDSWLETEDARLTLDGRVTECTTAPHLDATIATDTIDAAALPHYWPAHAAGAARDWFAEHVSTGTVAPLRVRVVAYAGDSDGIAVRIRWRAPARCRSRPRRSPPGHRRAAAERSRA
jgi:hypothetical protein